MLQALTPQNSMLWKKFKELTTNRVSSTEVASVLHMNPFKSRRYLFKQKTRQLKPEHWVSDSALNGLYQEQFAMEYLKKNTIFKKFDFKRPGLVLGQQYALCASPDLYCPKEKFGIEIKSLDTRAIPEKPEDVYLEHIIQCLVCCSVFQVTHWYLFYYNWRNIELSSCFLVAMDDYDFDSMVWPEVYNFLKDVQNMDEDAGLVRKKRKRNNDLLEQYLLSCVFKQNLKNEFQFE